MVDFGKEVVFVVEAYSLLKLRLVFFLNHTLITNFAPLCSLNAYFFMSVELIEWQYGT